MVKELFAAEILAAQKFLKDISHIFRPNQAALCTRNFFAAKILAAKKVLRHNYVLVLH